MSNTIFAGLIGAVAVPLIGWIFGMFLPNKAVEGAGIVVGKFLTIFFRQKIGKNWEPVEKYVQGTLDAFIRGLLKGLDIDDEPTS